APQKLHVEGMQRRTARPRVHLDLDPRDLEFWQLNPLAPPDHGLLHAATIRPPIPCGKINRDTAESCTPTQGNQLHPPCSTRPIRASAPCAFDAMRRCRSVGCALSMRSTNATDSIIPR